MASDTEKITEFTADEGGIPPEAISNLAYKLHGKLARLGREKPEFADFPKKLYSEIIRPIEELRAEIRDRLSREKVPSGLEELTYGERPVHQSTPNVNAELITKGDEVCECWIEVVEGMRVRTGIPARRLRGLKLNEGDEFLWSPAERVAMMKPREEDSAERQRLRTEILELQREFHEELKDLDIGLNDE